MITIAIILILILTTIIIIIIIIIILVIIIHSSLLTEAHKCEEELEISLSLRYPKPSFISARRPEVEFDGTNIKKFLKRAMIDKLQETVKPENWHGPLFTLRWKDECVLCLDKRLVIGTHSYSRRYDRTL